VNKKQFAVVKARLISEMENIESLKEELRRKGWLENQRRAKTALAKADSFVLRGLASVFHDFYTAVEKIMEIVAREIDEKMPAGNNWPRDLLRQMTLDVASVRPCLFSAPTAEMLDEFRSFRHVFRNVYGFNLSAERLYSLLLRFPQTAGRVEEEVKAFIRTMEKVFP